jgi:hypothetical protein
VLAVRAACTIMATRPAGSGITCNRHRGNDSLQLKPSRPDEASA